MINIVKYFLVILIFGGSSFIANSQGKDRLYPYPEFKVTFQQKLVECGAVPNQKAYHFVVLMNTTDTEGPVAHWMRNIYYGLISDYMKTGDHLSFVPYQLKVREDYAYWNKVYRPEDIKILNGKLPARPAIEGEYDGGHDDEDALLTALNKVNSDSVIYIQLTGSGASSRPRNASGYALTSMNILHDALEKSGVSKLADFRYDQVIEDKGRKNPFTIFCRLYAKTKLKSLANLSATRESNTNQIDVVIDEPVDKNKHDTNSAWGMITLIVVILCVVTGYVVWLYKPRNLQIGSISTSIKYGKRYYLGGANAGNNVITYPGVPDTKRIAVLEVGFDGKVCMRNEGLCRISKGMQRDRIIIGTNSAMVVITDNQTEEILYEFEVRETD